jgi:hypothetical protein
MNEQHPSRLILIYALLLVFQIRKFLALDFLL